MHRFITFLCLSLLAGCASPTSPRPIDAGKQPVYVKGTYMSGSNITEPRPKESRFFRTDHAGFVVLKKGAAYYLQAGVIKSPPSKYYIRVEYENPEDKSHPFTNDMDFPPTMDGVRFSSPDVVWGIRNYANYTIRVAVFTSRDSTQPVDTLVQPVRSYVDTTTGEVRIYNRMKAK